MKQLTILCSQELTERIIFALREEGIDGYIHIPDASANRFVQDDPITPFITWGATVLIVPAREEVIQRVANRLKEYADQCREAPCLKLLISPLEELY